MRKAHHACGGKKQRATLTIETTLDEIVDVVNVADANRALASCLREAVWRLVLPYNYAHFERETWIIELP